MRHRGWVDVAALLLMAGGAYLVWDLRNDELLRSRRDVTAVYPTDLDPFVWATVAAAAVLATASVAVLVAARAPHLARSSPAVAGVLVLVGGAAYVTPWARLLANAETWRPEPQGTVRLTSLLQPITGLVCVTALTAGVAVLLLRRSRSAPAATGAVVLWGAVTAAVVVRDGLERFSVPSVGLAYVDRIWVLAGTGLLVVAAGLLVTAWCAGPPAGRERVLARCRGGYAATALLLPQVAAIDVTLATLDFGPVAGPADGWLWLRAGLVSGAALAAAGAALLPRATPVLAAGTAVLGLASAAVNYLPAAEPLYVEIVGFYPVLVGALGPVLLAAVVAYAHRRLPAEPAPEPGVPEGAPVA